MGSKDAPKYTNQSTCYTTLIEWKIKKYIIISMDVEKIWQNWTFFYDKNSQRTAYTWNIIKALYDKPTANIKLNSKRLKDFPLRLGTGQGYPLSPLLFTIVFEILARAIMQDKEIKGI